MQGILDLLPGDERQDAVRLLAGLLTDDRLDFDDRARLTFAEDLAEVSRWWP